MVLCSDTEELWGLLQNFYILNNEPKISADFISFFWAPLRDLQLLDKPSVRCVEKGIEPHLPKLKADNNGSHRRRRRRVLLGLFEDETSNVCTMHVSITNPCNRTACLMYGMQLFD